MAAGDLFWDTVWIAMHMDSVGLTDVKGHAMTLNGGVTRSATQSKFGGYSAYFDGVDDEVLSAAALYELGDANHAVQFFCYPETQLMANPCVLAFQEYKIEYKPTGYPSGFVIDYAGAKTSLGEHPSGAWYFFWMVRDATTVTICINGVFVTTLTSVPDLATNALSIGSSVLSTNTDSAFKGYVDDLLMTSGPAIPADTTQGHVTRWDYSVPTIAFLERTPDPEGAGSGSMALTGSGAGIVAPIGPASGSLSFTGEGVGSVPCAGIASGRLMFTGLAQGVVGRTGIASGALRFTGSATGAIGSFGVGSGSLRFTGYATGKHGVSGEGSGSLRFTGSAEGSTPLAPVGVVSGSLRFSGYGYGLGGSLELDSCP